MIQKLKDKIEDLYTKVFDFLYRIYRIMGRLIIKYSSNPRPSSYPFITGDGFRNLANHVYDNLNKNIDVDKIKDRDVIFVGDDDAKEFLTKIHPQIKSSYILVTHNGDAKINQEVFNLIDDKVLKWYGINVWISDSKVVPIPLGIENKHYYVLGIPQIFKMVIKKNLHKNNRIFYGFSVANNTKERQPAMDVLKINPLAETFKKWMNFYQYLHLLSTYKFTASPEGSCVEGHRNYDAFYTGVIPIVKSSITVDYFEKIGMPLWNIKDWHELDNLTEKDLEEKFEIVKKNSNMETIYIDYWMDKIKNARD